MQLAVNFRNVQRLIDVRDRALLLGATKLRDQPAGF